MQPLVVPEDLDAGAIGQLYPVPSLPVESVPLADFEVPRPPSVAMNTFEQLVKIQSLEDRRWIYINIPTNEVWPRLRSLLNRNGIPVSRADGASGILETVWVKFSSDTENSHRFRISVSPAVQQNSTEITVLENQVPRGNEENSEWHSKSDSDDREMDIVKLIANDLVSSADYGSVSLLAQNIGGASKVDMVIPEVTDPYILMKLDFNRSWASVTYSAARGGFTIVDQNRSQGVLYVNFTEPDKEKKGFFGRLFSGNSEDDKLRVNYQVLVREAGANVEVRIAGPEGEAVQRGEALHLLQTLRGNLT